MSRHSPINRNERATDLDVSYVIVSYNRRERLLATLEYLHAHTPLPRDRWETWVVDNASSDGSAAAVRAHHPSVNVIANPINEGVWARTRAFPRVRGRYIVSLDDDSYPISETVPRSMAHMDANPSVASVSGAILLPDGRREACAFPSVLLGGASMLRTETMRRVGSFRPEFFRQAEEYDLSFRLWNAGLRVERFEDLIYRHDKVSTGRDHALTHRMDLRNNLILLERYAPAPWRKEYRADWIARYAAIARHAGFAAASRAGRRAGALWRLREAITGRSTLSPAAFETVFEIQKQEQMVASWMRLNRVRRVAIADFSKNLFATWNACQTNGLKAAAIIDGAAAFAGMNYRGIPVLNEDALAGADIDGIVLSNINPALVDGRLAQLRTRFDGPILRLWEPRFSEGAPQADGSPAVRAAA